MYATDKIDQMAAKGEESLCMLETPLTALGWSHLKCLIYNRYGSCTGNLKCIVICCISSLVLFITHPVVTVHSIMHILHCPDRCTKDHPNVGVLLMGDFNCLPDTSLKTFPLKQIVRAPTRGEATLDKIYTNNADWFSNPVIFLAIGNSDHNTTWN